VPAVGVDGLDGEADVCLALPLTVFFVLAAPEIVTGLLGEKWRGVVAPLRLLSVAGFLRALAATGGPLFAGTGRPHLDFWMNLARASAIAAAVYPLTRALGVLGTCTSVVFALVAALPVWAVGIRAVTPTESCTVYGIELVE
jgi:PST family polysaccharide transporter